MSQPNGTYDKIDRPNEEHDAVKLIALKLAKETEAIEQNAANDRSENVIRECHAADRRQPGSRRPPEVQFYEQKNDRDVTEGGNASYLVSDTNQIGRFNAESLLPEPAYGPDMSMLPNC